MPVKDLRPISSSGYVCIPKGCLRQDGLVDENGEIVDDQSVHVDRVDERCYLVRIPDGTGDLPKLAESDVVQREVAVEIRDYHERTGVAPTAD
jgi:hypothetical protein